MRLKDGHGGTSSTPARHVRVAVIGAALAASLALAPAGASAAEPAASKAAIRQITIGNFIVNRDVIALRGGQTTNVFAGCPGRTRFFTSGFFPFGVQRGAPRVNFVVTAIIPSRNGVTYRFFNPAAFNTFPVNIRVSAMCLTLGTVSARGAASSAAGDSADSAANAANGSGDPAVTKKKKAKRKGKPRLKARVIVKKVKVGAKKKKKGKKKRKGARSSAVARKAEFESALLLGLCNRDNEFPTAFGFEHGPTSQFLGARPTRRRGDVGLVGNFLFEEIDRLKFFVRCVRGEGPINLGAQIGGRGGTPPKPSIVNNLFTEGPSSGINLGDGLQQVNYDTISPNTILRSPPTPVGHGTWSGPSPFQGNFFGNSMTPGGGILMQSGIGGPEALLSELKISNNIVNNGSGIPIPVNDLFAPVQPQQNGAAPVAPQQQDGVCNFSSGGPGSLNGFQWNCNTSPANATFRLQAHPDNTGKTVLGTTIPGCTVDMDQRGVTCPNFTAQMGTANFSFDTTGGGNAFQTPMMGTVGFPPGFGPVDNFFLPLFL